MVIGTKEYGTWKDGSSIYKDSNGYYIVAYNPNTDKLYKKHLKGWTPKHDAPHLCLVKKRWTVCKKKKTNKTRKHK